MTPPQIATRQDVWCTQCRWRRPSFVSRERGAGAADPAFGAYADDVWPRIADHAGGMEHEVRIRQRTFHSDRTEQTIYRCLPSMSVRTSDQITGPVPPARREIRA